MLYVVPITINTYVLCKNVLLIFTFISYSIPSFNNNQSMAIGKFSI